MDHHFAAQASVLAKRNPSDSSTSRKIFQMASQRGTKMWPENVARKFCGPKMWPENVARKLRRKLQKRGPKTWPENFKLGFAT